MSSCRKELRGMQGCSNASLWLARCLQDNTDNAKSSLLNQAPIAAKNAAVVYEKGYRRHVDAFTGGGVCCRTFVTQGRLIVGLGSESVTETGITLNRIYGTPLIPGSALKGLTAHYCGEVLARSDKRFNKKDGIAYDAMFGSADMSGGVQFYDAWITPESMPEALKMDVMTPHHKDYYGDKTGEISPSDMEDPVPVPFLSVNGSFYVVISCPDTSDNGRKWAELAMDCLGGALRDWGVGGKTSSGYGRMCPGK